MWENIVAELSTYDSVDWIVLITGLCYGILSTLNKPICWIFGIISCALIAYKDFVFLGLFFDGVLQVIYVVLGIVGILNWTLRRAGAGAPKIVSLPWLSHINAWFLGVLCSIVLVLCVQFFFNPSFAFLDSLTTVFSIWATWLLIHRIYEHWIYWLFINIVYIYIFFKSGADLFAVLYFCYFIIAIVGLWMWNRIRIEESGYLEKV